MNSLQRLHREYNDILKDPPFKMDVQIMNNDFYNWKITFEGPKGTPYEGGKFTIDIKFQPDYPFTPPKVQFKTRIYHPNINSNGSICLNILKDEWSPALKVSKVLLSICALLHDPNADDALVLEIAQIFKNQRETFNTIAKEWTKNFAN